MAVRGDTQGLAGRNRNPKRVKALAYLHASEGGYSPEIAKLHLIDRFGLEAVTGRRVFGYGEMRRLIHAENIVHAYQSRRNSANWAEWTTSNPNHAAILAEAEKLAND